MMHLIWLTEWIKNRQGFPCLFHLMTGFYCPGCGGTRAVRRLLEGDLAGSFRYHPFVPYLALMMLTELTLFLITITTKGNRKKGESNLLLLYLRRMERRYKKWVTVGFIIILSNWIIKNIFLAAGFDLL